MNLKNRIRKYFTEKPKGNFWFWAFITLVIFRYVSPLFVYFLIFFQMGLIAPDVDFSPAMEKASVTLTNAFINLMELFFNAGKGIAIENPLIAKILFYGLGWLIWVIYFAMLMLILNLLRYGIAYLIRRFKK